MRKLKAIWKLIWSKRYIVYTTKSEFGIADVDTKSQVWHKEQLVSFLNDLIEAEESVEYVKTLLTEI